MSFAQSAICRTWQPARCVILCLFSCGERLCYRGTEVFLPVQMAAARDPRRANTPPSFAPQQSWRDWQFPFCFSFS